MEDIIDIRTALEQFGTGWRFGGSVTAGTQESWESVTWEDERGKPTWAELCAAHATTPPKEFDIPLSEVDSLITIMPTIGWELLRVMGIE